MDKLEEVKKLKQLLDEGIIDEDDFKKKKAQILGLTGNNTKEEIKEETEEPKATKTNKTKSKSLDDYEKELMEQSEQEDEVKEDSSTKSNDDYYQKEKLKARAKLDAEEEIRKNRKAEQKAVVDKGVTKTKRIFKWILAVLCWIVALGTALGVVEGNIIVNIISVLIYLVLGCMACPKITDITKNNSKFDSYTKHKTLLVWILIIVWVVLISVFPVPNTEADNNSNTNDTNTVETNK